MKMIQLIEKSRQSRKIPFKTFFLNFFFNRSSFRQDDDIDDDVEESKARKQLNGARGTISPLTDNDFDGHGKILHKLFQKRWL